MSNGEKGDLIGWFSYLREEEIMKKFSLITFLIVSLLLPSSTIAGEQIASSKGQTVFIPAAWTDHSYQNPDGTATCSPPVLSAIYLRC